MKKSSNLIVIAQAPPTGTEGGPPITGCQRIATDQQGVPWGDMAQPWGVDDWVRGQSTLAIGKFEGYAYFNVAGGLDQNLVMSQVTGTFANNENLEIATSEGGPWTDTGIDTATPVNQVPVDCDTGCFGAECDPGGDPPIILVDDDIIATPPNDMIEVGATPFGEWTTRYSYRTTIPGDTAPPFTSGSVTGATTGAIAQVSHWVDPFPASGNLILHVIGESFGRNATRFIHGELLDHGKTTAQVTLANPMEETGPIPPPAGV